jgi:hypothetical protein
MDESNEAYNVLPDNFKHNCSECLSLCCVALKIDWGEFQKPQDVPCDYLTDDFKCSSWDRLADVGRSSCYSFFCLNTGPSVSAPLFDARTDWREISGIAPVLFNEFRKAYIVTFRKLFDIDPEV